MARSGLRPCEDSSNTDISYTRNRLRHGVLPVLRGMFADLELRLLGAAGLAELVEEYTRRETEKLECRRQDGGIRIQKRDPAGDVAECGWRRAVEEAAALLAEPEQGRLRKAQAAALTGLLAGGGAQMLCGGLQLRREGEGLFLRGRSGAGPEKMPLLLAAGPEELRGDLLFEDAFCRLTVRLVRLGGDIPDRDNPWVEYIDPQRIRLPLMWRMPRTGERMRGMGRSPCKRISEILKDRKVPRERRALLRVIADAEGVLWLPGVFPAGRCACTDLAGEALRVEISLK